MHRSLRILLAVLTLAFAVGPRVASAAKCTITTFATFNFGNYNQFSGTPLDTTSTMAWDCNGGRTPQVGLSAGGSGVIANRQMRNGAQTLRYNIYTDIARSTVFDTLYDLPGTFSLTLYGRIPAGQLVMGGLYQETPPLVFSLNF